MSIDNIKAKYSSMWGIDQQIDSETISVSSGTTAIYTLASSADPSVHEMQFKPTGSTKWYTVGTNATSNTLATKFTFYTYTQGTSLYVVTTSAGDIRYYIYQDAINYV